MNRIVHNLQRKGLTDLGTEESRASFQALGGLLLDIGRLKDEIVLPGNGEEINSLAEQVLEAHLTREPIQLFTPFCPDWSRDEQGRYDFKSLGGDISFIAKKFFAESAPLLETFQRYDIPYKGTLIFANWGLETEIDAKDTYGRKLSSEDVRMCFSSTFAQTAELLAELSVGTVFDSYDVIEMTTFFELQRIKPNQTYEQMRKFFQEDRKGKKLVDRLHAASLPLNKQRLGVNEETNLIGTVQNLAEYATLGQALGQKGIVIAAESATTTHAYNLPRQVKLPIFYLKGSRSLDRGENIL